MQLSWVKYSQEVVEFLNVDTLRKIDYGILDLSRIRNPELRGVLIFFEELLSLELKVNYLENDTGLFRVRAVEGGYLYNEFGYEVEADSISELKEMVLAEDRIWYVFDEISACRHLGGSYP